MDYNSNSTLSPRGQRASDQMSFLRRGEPSNSMSRVPSSDSAPRRFPGLPPLRPSAQPSPSSPPANPGSLHRSRIAVVLAQSPQSKSRSTTPSSQRLSATYESHFKDDPLDWSRYASPGTADRISAPTSSLQNSHPQMPSLPTPDDEEGVTRPLQATSSRGRGRPKGWKRGMSYSTMRGNPPPGARLVKRVKAVNGDSHSGQAQRSGVQGMRRRGRPAKQASPPPAALYSTLRPDFLAFLCEWEGCKAELHNLETLRRHVYAIHGKSERCLWGNCDTQKDEPTKTFSNQHDFTRHMEDLHLVPIGWHCGDGPANSARQKKHERVEDVQQDLPQYLMGSDGKQVTPSIRDQELEDIVTWKNNRRKLAALIRRRDENLPSDDSDESSEDDAL